MTLRQSPERLHAPDPSAALCGEAVEALQDLAFEGRVRGLDPESLRADLDDPTGSLSRAARVLREAEDA